jgi:hypothetical protein
MTAFPAGDELRVVDSGLNGPDGPPPLPNAPASRSWRRSIGWSATSVPVAFLLVTGMAFGPRGVTLLSQSALSLLGPVIPVALGALGVLVGMSIGVRRPDERRVLAAACLEAVVTMLVVSAGIAALTLSALPSMDWPFWVPAVTGGICAATSLTLPTGNALEPRTPTTRIMELGVLLPVVSGGLVLANLREGSFVGAVVLVAQATGITVALAGAGWLLLTQASSETEERVFAISALLLIGGVADTLSLSALFGGLIAGVFWRYAGRHPRDTISRDVLFVQHPLVVLVLLVAGARADFSLVSVGLGAGYLVLRVAGKLAGGALATRAAVGRVPGDLGLRLLPPGVFGVAFALNLFTSAGEDASVLLSAVVIGTIGSEVLTLLLRPRGPGE